MLNRKRSKSKTYKTAAILLFAVSVLSVAGTLGYFSHGPLGEAFAYKKPIASSENTAAEAHLDKPKNSTSVHDSKLPSNSRVLNKLATFSHYEKEILPIIQNYCADCHMEGSDKGDLDLDKYDSITAMLQDREIWQTIKDHIDWKLMPPDKKDQPSLKERKVVSHWIENSIFAVDPNRPDPGPLSGRRLNRIEYANTVKDLFFVDTDIHSFLPPDDSGNGFDNHGANLTISPTHVKKYLLAAEKVLHKAFPIASTEENVISLDLSEFQGRGTFRSEGFVMLSGGVNRLKVPKIIRGNYDILISGGQHKMGNENAKVELSINNKIVETLKMTAVYPEATRFRLEGQSLSPGDQIGINFVNDAYERETKRDRNAFVYSITLKAKADTSAIKSTTFTRRYNIAAAEKQLKLSGKPPISETRRILIEFAENAFRRNIKPYEIEPYLDFLKVSKANKESALHGIRLAMQAIMLSPHFLFIDNPHRHPNYQQGETLNKQWVSQHALASRLSYFLWSAPPDKQLRSLANLGQLRENLSTEVTRMLSSPKAIALIENFAGQWLQTRDLPKLRPDQSTYPDINQQDLSDLQQETMEMLKHVMLDNKPLTDLLHGNYSFLNENLAKYYGMNGVSGNNFRKVSLQATRRRGILTHGSILILTSTPTRTSPVLRGKYVLDNILDAPPPPPPADIAPLDENSEHTTGLTLKQELEKHREKSACAACHRMMDPIGFAFESYDAAGKFRSIPVKETEGKLFTGENFKDLVDLQNILATDRIDDFANCISKKLLSYALGRELEYFDKTTVMTISDSLKNSGYKFHSAIQTLVQSAAFLSYRSK